MVGTVEELLHTGVVLRFVSIGAYAAAFIGYAVRLGVQRLKLDKLATLLASFGVLSHTAYLLVRWIAAGQIEILARERTGEVLTGMDRFWWLISHPPYTNLFDALNFVAWALMVCYLIVERKWGLRVVGVLAVAIALVTMGEAALVSDKQLDIDPLVPALQSYWILIHVGMLFVSYALFTIGAITALLYLIKTNLPTAILGGVQAASSAIFLALIGGSALLRGVFEMAPNWIHQTPSRLRPGKLLDVITPVHHIPAGAEKPVKYLTAVPGVGPFLLVALVLLAAGAVVYALEHRRKSPLQGAQSRGFQVTAAGFAALTIGLAVLVYRIVTSHEVAIPSNIAIAPGEHGPFFFSLAGNYALGLVALVWGTTLGFLVTALIRDRIAATLPEPRKLEDVTYKMVIAGWPLLTIGIVMGGMWAYEAWGRFWGWDPKETWALITWVVYAGYLHTRITMGWSGRKPAAIAVFAFAVVVFTFMGVNLGLTGEGLHSYGAG